MSASAARPPSLGTTASVSLTASWLCRVPCARGVSSLPDTDVLQKGHGKWNSKMGLFWCQKKSWKPPRTSEGAGMRSWQVHLSKTRSSLQLAQINPSLHSIVTHAFLRAPPMPPTAFSRPLLSSTHRALKPNLSGTQEAPGARGQSRMPASPSGEQGSGWLRCSRKRWPAEEGTWVGVRDNQARQTVHGWMGGWMGGCLDE